MTLKYGIKKIVFAFVMITVLMLSICTSAFAAEAVYDEAGLFSDADVVEIKNDSQSLAAYRLGRLRCYDRRCTGQNGGSLCR